MSPRQSDPEEQKRLFLAILLCGGILFAWQAMFPPPVQPPKQPGKAAAGADAGKGKSAAAGKGTRGAGKKTAVRDAEEAPSGPSFQPKVVHALVSAGRERVEVDDAGQIVSWTLEEEQYRVREPTGTRPYRFVDALDPKGAKGGFMPPLLELSIGGEVVHPQYAAEGAVLTARVSGVDVRREFSLVADGYTVEERITLKNTRPTPVKWDLTARLRAAQHRDEASVSLFNQPIYLFEGVCKRASELEREPLVDVQKAVKDPDKPTAWDDGIRWAGVDNRYFMNALLLDEGQIKRCEFITGPEAAGFEASKVPAMLELITTRVELKGGTLTYAEPVTRRVRFYAGPKKLSVLDSASPPLSEAIDFGWFSPICLPMLFLMRVFNTFLGNWGLAIILLTILVKVLTLPLTHKQYKSMAAMKLIQPQMQALQAKYKDDKLKLQQKMMELYKENNVRPLAGCLPALAMMPIYFALYRTIYSAVELFQAPFAFWIHDLSAKDPYFVTPVLLGGLMFIQTRLNPQAGDQTQQKIMMTMMPVMFTAFMLFLPSGLVVYIAVNTVLGIVQQMVLLKKGEETSAVPAKAKAS